MILCKGPLEYVFGTKDLDIKAFPQNRSSLASSFPKKLKKSVNKVQLSLAIYSIMLKPVVHKTSHLYTLEPKTSSFFIH